MAFRRFRCSAHDFAPARGAAQFRVFGELQISSGDLELLAGGRLKAFDECKMRLPEVAVRSKL